MLHVMIHLESMVVLVLHVVLRVVVRVLRVLRMYQTAIRAIRNNIRTLSTLNSGAVSIFFNDTTGCVTTFCD